MFTNINFLNKRVNIFLFFDITQVQQQEKVKLEVKFKNIFLSSVSHNLKTPINSNFLFQYDSNLGLIMNNQVLKSIVTDESSRLA